MEFEDILLKFRETGLIFVCSTFPVLKFTACISKQARSNLVVYWLIVSYIIQ